MASRRPIYTCQLTGYATPIIADELVRNTFANQPFLGRDALIDIRV